MFRLVKVIPLHYSYMELEPNSISAISISSSRLHYSYMELELSSIFSITTFYFPLHYSYMELELDEASDYTYQVALLHYSYMELELIYDKADELHDKDYIIPIWNWSILNHRSTSFNIDLITLFLYGIGAISQSLVRHWKSALHYSYMELEL